MTQTTSLVRQIYIDPSSDAYYENRLFDESDPFLNRDDSLAPYVRLKRSIAQQGNTIVTADYLFNSDRSSGRKEYYSLGILHNLAKLAGRTDVLLRGFVIFEPPVVMPELYRVLPRLTTLFERVYVHNTRGDGYSLDGVDRSRLHKLLWPQPHNHVIEPFWSNPTRAHRIVIINGNHKPRSERAELYSSRIEAMAALAQLQVVDLYGRGWNHWWSRQSAWFPYWRHRRELVSIYKGPCISKFEMLSRYTFCLCFENMAMEGYVTEKLFDCLYTGTIPLYLGAKDITDLVPGKAYIDCRNYETWEEMWRAVSQLPPDTIRSMRQAGREFVESAAGQAYFKSLNNIFMS